MTDEQIVMLIFYTIPCVVFAIPCVLHAYLDKGWWSSLRDKALEQMLGLIILLILSPLWVPVVFSYCLFTTAKSLIFSVWKDSFRYKCPNIEHTLIRADETIKDTQGLLEKIKV